MLTRNLYFLVKKQKDQKKKEKKGIEDPSPQLLSSVWCHIVKGPK